MLRKLEHIWWKGCREEKNLDVPWKKLEDLINIFLEASAKDLVCLVKTEHCQIVRLEEAF